jgi:hypothetical protein
MGTCYTLYCPDKKTALYIGKAYRVGVDIYYETVSELLYENTSGEVREEEEELTEYGERLLAWIEEWADREGVTTYKVWNDCSGEHEPWLEEKWDDDRGAWSRRPGWTMHYTNWEAGLLHEWSTR